MKKLVCALLALVMLLSLCACGSADKDGVSPQQPVTSGDTEKPEQDEVEKKSDTTQEFIDAINVETATEKGVCGTDLTWYYLDNVLVIKGTGAMTDYEAFVNNAPWDKKDLEDDIHWVLIEEGVTSIGNAAFDGAGGYELLSKIVLPSTLETIGDSAFYSCHALSSITIPKNVVYIGDGAFWEKTMTEIVIEGDAPEMCLDSTGTALIGLPGANSERPQSEITIYYSGSGFEPYIEACPGYNWVKQ